MKKIGLYIFLVVFLLIIIPIIILGGVGNGLGLPTKLLPGIIGENPKNNIKIKVYRTDINKVEEMDFDDYLIGVIAGEMPASWDINALKAQAIAARTYAAAKMKQFGGASCPKYPDAGEYDVCSDVHCQKWITKEERFKAWEAAVAVEYWDKITKAVKETSGKVMTYEGKLASAVKYHASSGGKTEDSLEVFGYSAPYLVSVDSEYEVNNPKLVSEVKMSKADFIKKILAINPKTKVTEKNLASSIKVLELTDSGRVKSMKIGDQTFKGDAIRWGMELKSTAFTVKVNSKDIVFDVRGSGHGVGMPQWGAKEMADRGKKYDEILKYYYKGIEINDISDIFKYKTQ